MIEPASFDYLDVGVKDFLQNLLEEVMVLVQIPCTPCGQSTSTRHGHQRRSGDASDLEGDSMSVPSLLYLDGLQGQRILPHIHCEHDGMLFLLITDREHTRLSAFEDVLKNLVHGIRLDVQADKHGMIRRMPYRKTQIL